MKTKLFLLLLLILLAFILGKQLMGILNRKEIRECKMWTEEAKQYKYFTVQTWQTDQCYAHNIIINPNLKVIQ